MDHYEPIVNLRTSRFRDYFANFDAVDRGVKPREPEVKFTGKKNKIHTQIFRRLEEEDAAGRLDILPGRHPKNGHLVSTILDTPRLDIMRAGFVLRFRFNFHSNNRTFSKLDLSLKHRLETQPERNEWEIILYNDEALSGKDLRNEFGFEESLVKFLNGSYAEQLPDIMHQVSHKDLFMGGHFIAARSSFHSVMMIDEKRKLFSVHEHSSDKGVSTDMHFREDKKWRHEEEAELMGFKFWPGQVKPGELQSLIDFYMSEMGDIMASTGSPHIHRALDSKLEQTARDVDIEESLSNNIVLKNIFTPASINGMVEITKKIGEPALLSPPEKFSLWL